MSFISAFEVSSSAISAQRVRMDLASSNLANAQTTRGADGKPYQKLMPVFQTALLKSEEGLDDENAIRLSKVELSSIEKDQTPPKRIYDPGHPDADKDGYVSMPNINLMEEMADLLMASRTYEANVTAFNTTKSMVMKVLDLGKV